MVIVRFQSRLLQLVRDESYVDLTTSFEKMVAVVASTKVSELSHLDVETVRT